MTGHRAFATAYNEPERTSVRREILQKLRGQLGSGLLILDVFRAYFNVYWKVKRYFAEQILITRSALYAYF